MLERLLQSSLFRAASLYGISNLLSKALPVLLVPVLTRHLTPQDYGTMAVFGVLVSVFTPFVGVSVHGAINRKYFDRGEVDYPAYVKSCLCVIAGATAGVALLLVAVDGFVATASDIARPWVWAALVVASGQMVTLALLALQQASQQALAYSVIQVSRTALVAILTLWFVVGVRLDWRGSLSAQLAGATAFTLISLVLFGRAGMLRPKVRRAYMRHALGFGMPLIPHALSGVAIQTIDRLFVTHYAGLEQTGLYSLGYQVGMLIGLLTDSFDRAWQPWLFERLKQAHARAKRQIVAFTYAYFVAIAAVAIGLGMLSPWLLSIVVGKSFYGASVHVIWIALGYAFEGMYRMVVSYLFFAERTGMLAWLTMTSAGVNIALNFLLVPRYGAVGAAQATTGAFLCSFVLSWFVAARVHPMPWALWRRSDGG